jgi:hypothetical protein
MSQAKIQVSVRIDRNDLAQLERLGAAAKPVPANRNQMIGVAIRDYVDRHPAPAEQPAKRRASK